MASFNHFGIGLKDFEKFKVPIPTIIILHGHFVHRRDSGFVLLFCFVLFYFFFFLEKLRKGIGRLKRRK